MSISYAFLRRNCYTMQHGNSSFFSQNGFPPRCQMMLSLRACATVRRTRFLHSGAMENVTCTRTVQNYIPSSWVHLSSPIRLHRLRDRFDGTWKLFFIYLFIYLLVTSRNNRSDELTSAQTDISQRDKVLFFLWSLVVF